MLLWLATALLTRQLFVAWRHPPPDLEGLADLFQPKSVFYFLARFAVFRFVLGSSRMHFASAANVAVMVINTLSQRRRLA